MAAKGNGQKDPDFQIDDPEELSQKTRIKELLSRRTNVIDARDQAFDAMTLGQASEEQALNFYRSRVESLILDLWTKFENEDLDKGAKYLTSEPIDTVYVPPPPELSSENLAPGVTPPEPKPRKIAGLKWFIENEGFVTAEFTAQSWDPPGERTVVNRRTLPRRTIDRGLVKCMEFIDEAGIDVAVEDNDKEATADYSDILEEGGE